MVFGLRQINPAAMFLYRSIFFRWRHLHCLLWFLSFYASLSRLTCIDDLSNLTGITALPPFVLHVIKNPQSSRYFKPPIKPCVACMLLYFCCSYDVLSAFLKIQILTPTLSSVKFFSKNANSSIFNPALLHGLHAYTHNLILYIGYKVINSMHI